MLNFVVRNSTNENVYWYELRPNIYIIVDIKSTGWSVLSVGVIIAITNLSTLRQTSFN